MSAPPSIQPVKLKTGPHEAKFEIPGTAAHRVHALLKQRLPADPEYPDALVYSLYYDSPSLRYLEDKEGSDYLKTKVRIRWYGDPETFEPLPDAFLEAKSKEGASRFKERIHLPGAAPEIASMRLDDPRLVQLIKRLSERGVDLARGLTPLVLIRYRRRRFVLPRLNTRVCIDSDIQPIDGHPSLGAVMPRPLPSAVMEVKGGERVLPTELIPMSSLGARLNSFSKYLRCVDAIRMRP